MATDLLESARENFMKIARRAALKLAAAFFIFAAITSTTFANVPGGGTNGADVTLTDNGSTVTIANGIVSILCTKSGATINQINYTYNNGGGTQTINLLSGGNNGGQLYWELGNFGGSTFTYSLIADPAANGGNYAEISLLSTSASSGAMEVRFSMLRGSTGFYVTAIWYHRSADAALTMGETRDNIYAGSIFNWMSVDTNRNRLMEVSGGSAIGVQGAPVEVSLWTNGIYAGQYEDKYKYSADFGDQRVWGWSSVGAGGKNVGLWNVSASTEYYGGGPMKRELMSHIGTTILNMTKGSHYGGGTDSSWASGEIWTHVYGPYFIYCNNITNTITATNQAAQALYSNALAQAAAEATAWPYSWFTNDADYAPASGRGTITGQMVINDIYNPNASASNLWVGVVQQPLTGTSAANGGYDFQEWMKPYQFWIRTDANGNFTIPNVIAGANYTLYAFGSGAAGTFQSQALSGGSAPNSVDIPASPFSVTVTAGATNNLGMVTWTPTRIGPTVFEIGYPDRTARKFRHGEDWWVGDIGPSPANPSPVWSKWLEYPFDFPSGPNYVVGQSRWTTDWNFVQPIVTDSSGNYVSSTSTITFNLPSAPTGNGSFYIALSSDYQGAPIIQVNGNNIAGSTGYIPSYSGSGSESDSTIREGIHGMFSDNRLGVSSSFLHQGQNTITISIRQIGGSYFSDHAMYDYIRLELPGYIPPPPPSVAAYAGNNCNLICWPATPGATSYNILRSTMSGSGYVSITNGVIGPVCGSGWNNAAYLDTTAANNTTYYYVVQSVNPVGASTNSPESPDATPNGSISTSAPDAPTGLTIGGSGHQSVALNWSASANANFYTVYRSTLFNNGGGASNVLNTIVLANNVTDTSYTDTSPTDGSIYSYSVTATSTGGTSGNSTSAVAVPLPSAPASAPGSLTGSFSQTTNVVLNWSPVSGAVGYVIRRATSPGGPFTFLQSVTETTYTDVGLDVTLAYYYQVAAMNAAGVSANATVTVTAPPGTPTSLSAIPGDSQVTLNWSAVANAAGYYLYRGTGSGNENTLVVGNYSGTSFTNTGLANGTTYYYVVAATNAVGLGPNSPEANATPNTGIILAPRNLTWKGDGSANLWNVSGAANWQSNGIVTVFNNGDSATFDNTGSNNVAVTLAGNLQPALVTYSASKNYTFSGTGSIAGTNELIKSGTGTLTISTTNTYSGGTILSNGTVTLGSANANLGALGSGAVTFDGGTLEFNGWTGSTSPDYGGNANALVIPANRTGTIHVPQRFLTPGLAGTLSGGGILNLMVKYVRGDIPGDWSAFTGTINVINGSGGDDFRVANANGWPNAKLNIGAAVNMYSRAAANSVIPIGEFSGASTATVAADGAGGLGGKNAVTWRVGGLNTDTTNAAAFQGIVALIKEGTGAWTLTGASTHTGTTVVSNGTLLVNGSFSGSPVTANGGKLGGIGTISGAVVTINSGGGFAPGNPLGVLSVSNNLTLAAGSTTFIQVQHSPLTNNAATISDTLTEGGTLNVTNIGGSALTNGDSFKLFTAGNYSGSFAGFVLPALPAGLGWKTNLLNVDGTLSVIVVATPFINVSSLSQNGFVFNGTGGVASATFYLLGTTNLSQPLTNWARLLTNHFDNSGNFNFTNAPSTNWPQAFYLLQEQ
jgi:autotransporter-associated beta strand protein